MARSKRAKKVRKAEEFDTVERLARILQPPDVSTAAYSWSIAEIMAARDDQLRGSFRRPSQLAESMRTDDALFSAWENRLAPSRCIDVEIRPARGARGRAIGGEGEALFGPGGIAVCEDTLSDVLSDLINHGVAFGQVENLPRADGSRHDMVLHSWPIEFVRWDTALRCFVTQVEHVPAGEASTIPGFSSYHEVPIRHGDGRWVVFTKHQRKPWSRAACLLAGALIWARHAHGVRDWAKASATHGNAKVVGELPQGVPLVNKDGTISAQATAFLGLLKALASLGSPAGIRPAGSKTDYIVNTSSAWQVWKELVMNAEKAAARVYLGTDGTLGSVGGAPGVDIATLFGVATTKVQSDLQCIERSLHTGIIEPWCAINFGTSELAPRRCYLMPDPDAAAARDDYAKRSEQLWAHIRALRELGFVVDQDVVDRLAKEYGVTAPVLAPAPADQA